MISKPVEIFWKVADLNLLQKTKTKLLKNIYDFWKNLSKNALSFNQVERNEVEPKSRSISKHSSLLLEMRFYLYVSDITVPRKLFAFFRNLMFKKMSGTMCRPSGRRGL